MRITIFVLGFMVCLAAAGCRFSGADGDMTFSGTLELTDHALGAKSAGRLTALSVDEGDLVSQGQILAKLDRYDQTFKDYERLQALAKTGGATAQELEHAALENDDQKIVSPVNGVVLVKVHETGEALSAGSPVVVVGDRSALWVRIFVPEGKVNRVRMNQPAVFRFDGLTENFRGHVSFIAPQAEFTPRNVQTAEERVTQTFAVKVTLDNPPDYLRPGVAAEVTLE